MADVMASPVYLDLRTPKLAVGGPSFDFELPALGSGELVRLSSFAGSMPVGITFREPPSSCGPPFADGSSGGSGI